MEDINKYNNEKNYVSDKLVAGERLDTITRNPTNLGTNRRDVFRHTESNLFGYITLILSEKSENIWVQ